MFNDNQGFSPLPAIKKIHLHAISFISFIDFTEIIEYDSIVLNSIE